MREPRSFVLVIDDDEDIRETVAEVLEMNDFRVETAANGREALDQMRAGARVPSLILLDLMMPVMDGWAFMEEFTKDPRLAAVPVVVFSAHGSSGAASVPSVAARAFLSKPLTMRELVATVERYAVDPKQ